MASGVSSLEPSIASSLDPDEAREQASLFGLPYDTPEEQTITDRFMAWIKTENGRVVFDLFVNHALDAYDAGLKKIGAKAIWERLRWSLLVEKKVEEEYKMNNSHVSRIVRMAVRQHPCLETMFEFRKLRSK